MIALAQPWLLAATGLLPFAYLLIRRAPPRPRLVRLPSIVLLGPDDLPPAPARRPPLWLVLLRLGALALMLAGLAGPSWRAAAPPAGGPVALVIDNGWAATGGWEQLRATADRELAALPDDARVTLLATADPPVPVATTPAAARATLAALAARPWPADRARTARALPPESRLVWIADGIETADADPLRAQGGQLAVVGPVMPAIRTAVPVSGGWRVALAWPPGAAAARRLVAIDGAGREIARADAASGEGEIRLGLPPGAVAERLAVDGAGAMGVFLTAGADGPARVVIVDGEGEAGAPALARGAYYVRRALEPHAPVRAASLAGAARGAERLIVLVDVPVRPGPVGSALLDRVARGAVAVTFAGPRVARGSRLSPVSVAGARGGGLAWDAPRRLGRVAASGPLAGLDRFPEAVVRRQVVGGAAPGAMQWALLDDGTPLVTARRHGAGLLVLVHTAAAPGWSTLPLTGLLEALLVRLLPLARDPARLDVAGIAPWSLEAVLAGDGTLAPPERPARLAAAKIARAPLAEAAPPGLWRSGGLVRARNVASALGPTFAFTRLSTRGLAPTTVSPPLALGPWLFAAGLALAALDGLLAAARGGRWRLRLLAPALAMAVAAPAMAQTPGQVTVDLGHVVTGNPARDAAAAAGLAELARTLTTRTAVGARVSAVDASSAGLGRFALVYWPGGAAPSPAAAARARDYLGRGGLIILDSAGQAAPVLAALDPPPLERLAAGHVVNRAYYLVSAHPGARGDPPVWVEAGTAGSSGRVARLIVGSADWARAWSGADPAAQEMALRWGVNLVVYALTGTYKADAVHARALLERGRSTP